MPNSSAYGSRRTVAVVLVTWNQKHDAAECLLSLIGCTWKALDIIVVDNGSTDGTPESVKASFPQVHVIQSASNLGFPGATNLGIRYALTTRSEFIFLLNTDTVLAQDCISHLVDAMDREPRLGIAAPKMYFHGDPQRIWFAGGTTDPDTGFSHHWDYGTIEEKSPDVDDTLLPCTFITGAGMFIRPDVFARVGLLDEDFFHTAEDNDLCIRSRRAGFTLAVVPRAHLWHKVMSTTGGAHRTSPVYAYYEYRNKLYLVKKHSSNFAWLKNIPLIGYNIAKAEARILIREKNPAAAAAILNGIADFFRGLMGRKRSAES